MDRLDRCSGTPEETLIFKFTNTMRSVAFLCQPSEFRAIPVLHAASETQTMKQAFSVFPLSYPEE
jgi:hypothetical protein